MRHKSNSTENKGRPQCDGECDYHLLCFRFSCSVSSLFFLLWVNTVYIIILTLLATGNEKRKEKYDMFYSVPVVYIRWASLTSLNSKKPFITCQSIRFLENKSFVYLQCTPTFLLSIFSLSTLNLITLSMPQTLPFPAYRHALSLTQSVLRHCSSSSFRLCTSNKLSTSNLLILHPSPRPLNKPIRSHAASLHPLLPYAPCSSPPSHSRLPNYVLVSFERPGS